MPSVAAQPSGTSPPAFDLGRAWHLNPRVALRHESFGALAYHFGTRRLSFLKSPVLLALVTSLVEYSNAEDAFRAADIAAHERGPYIHALGSLAASDMIIPRETV